MFLGFGFIFVKAFISFTGKDKLSYLLHIYSPFNKNILGESITLTDKIEEIDTSIAELKNILNTSIEERLDTLDSSVNKIESSYLSDVSLAAPSLTNEQFNSVTVTKTENGTETTVSVDIANEKYYTALNNALETLQSNDEYLASLLTWKNLD